VPESVPPSASVAVASHTTVSEGDAVELESVRLELLPRVLEPLVQAYVMVGEPPSASVAVAEQVNVELVVTPLLGVIDTVATTGSLLPTLTLSVLESVPPSESVAVASQTIVSDGDAVELVKVRIALVPKVLVPLVHS
jgi:hypothetical protein